MNMVPSNAGGEREYTEKFFKAQNIFLTGMADMQTITIFSGRQIL